MVASEQGSPLTKSLPEPTLLLHPETMWPVVHTIQVSKDGERDELRLYFGSYETVNGFPIPFHTEAKSDGGTIVIDLRSVQFNSFFNPRLLIRPREVDQELADR